MASERSLQEHPAVVLASAAVPLACCAVLAVFRASITNATAALLLVLVVVAAAARMPVFAYHWPKVSPPGISIEDLKALNVAAIKDSTGDTERMLETLAVFKKPFYSGNASVVAYAGMLGCTGAILAAANFEPERCIDAFAGDIAAQKDLLSAHKIVSIYGVKGIKEELARRYGTSTVCR